MTAAVATYNIHACIGSDGRFDPNRVLRVIQELDVDVLALQEVEHHAVDGIDLLDYFAAESGLQAIPGPTLLRGTRQYGNALLSRFPPVSLNRADLSVPGREARGALDALFDCGGKKLQVVATHLGLKPRERREQVRRVLPLFEPEAADVSVLMGDLNEWFLWGRISHWLRRRFQATPYHATFPSRWPLLALDKIWVNPADRVKRFEVHRSRVARRASDHLPLKAVIEL
ncbi:MAG TPA: endonuclease/exonuclease/phosphatase family protein [Gammaproteobacteria bacterium]|nr:endonuclease/exonuclease/phosphatase family protein [Gammaproteobacteria bacterium]